MICLYVVSKLTIDDFQTDLVAAMFALVWFKAVKYLQVFKATRYLIQMILDVIYDIKIFLMILFVVVFAYGQILISIDPEGPYELMTRAYGLAFGDLGDYSTFSYVKFSIFAGFSFLIPLVMMNLLIAIMSDSYARV